MRASGTQRSPRRSIARRRLAVRPPFRALLREHWLALHCPGAGWVWLFPDQLDPAAVTPLRQVLFLQRR